MINTLFGTKGKMSHAFVKDTRVPVTHIKTGPCVVTHIKNIDKDGYWAVQLGFGEKKLKNINKPQKGHLKGAMKSTKKAPRFLREVRLSKKPSYKVGDKITIDKVFKKGDVVRVTGISKGKGFTGVVKRWNFKGGPRTHGQSDRLRAPGSIGQGTDPGRVRKGKKMAGRSGGVKKTVLGLNVVEIDKDTDTLAVSGSVPGHYNSFLAITKLGAGKLSELIEEAPQQVVTQEEQEEEKENE